MLHLAQGCFGSRPPSQIAPNLWQAGFPQDPERLANLGVRLIVLCAKELQPRDAEEAAAAFPRLRVVCAPMDDDPSGPNPYEIDLATRAARQVVATVRAGATALVTCQQGRNRSGLVTALALCDLYGISGAEATRRIRAARFQALTNPGFAAFLAEIR